MRAVVAGLVADELGLCVSLSLRQGRYGPDLVRDHYARPAIEYRSAQAQRIALDLDHGRTIGTVSYLEHLPGSGLWAVAVVDELERLPDEHRWFSPQTLAYGTDGGAIGTDVQLQALALTDDPGSNAAQRVTVLPGDLASLARSDRLRRYPEMVRRLVGAAQSNKVGTATIHGRITAVLDPEGYEQVLATRRAPNTSTKYVRLPDGAMAEVHHHGGGRVLSVR